MLTPQQALERVLAATPSLGTELVHLGSARDRVLARDVRAGRDVPPFRNSAMDGFALRHADVADRPPPFTLPVTGTIAAGAAPADPLAPGTAVAIMTGAVLPPGADTVVRIEDTESTSNQVTIRTQPRQGDHVREPGEDLRAGEVALAAGHVLRPADIGVAASVGHAVIAVVRRPVVAIIATGDELVELGQPLEPGQIANSNAYTLAAAVEEAGGVARMLGTTPDNRDATRTLFAAALEADVILSTGGVSMGTFDLVREVLADLGVEEQFWKIAQKPGKPLSFGLRGNTLVFGLPGNPVSALVCFELYVRPALRRLGGHRALHHPVITAEVLEVVRTAPGLTEFVRVTLDGPLSARRARPTGTQSSGVLRSLSQCDGLLIASDDVGTIAAGTHLPVLDLRAAPTVTSPFATAPA